MAKLPEHKNPTLPDRTACAPYNFIPLPEKVVQAVANPDELPSHGTYHNPTHPHTGYFDVELTTRSPVYIRCGLQSKSPGVTTETLSQFEKSELEKLGSVPSDFTKAMKNLPDVFYTHGDLQPVIPGSSIRGMLRSLLEIVSYGKVQPVMNKRLFYRKVGDSRMVENLNFVREGANPRARGFRARVLGGFFRRRTNGTFSIEECAVARIDSPDIALAFGLRNSIELYELNHAPVPATEEDNPNLTPAWTYQHKQIWVNVLPERDHFFPAQYRPNGRMRHPNLYLRFSRASNPGTAPTPGKSEGTLVLTGPMKNKHLAFIFIDNPTNKRSFDVPNDYREKNKNKKLVDLFEGEDQLTQWQKEAFPSGTPGSRKVDGHLHDGEPVFFLVENNQVVFFGRAQMFRMPYQNTPLDLVPDFLRDPNHLDYAESLFGFIRRSEDVRKLHEIDPSKRRQGAKARSYAGRISVSDARLKEAPEGVSLPSDPPDGILIPRILAGPKPTAYQHYLTQQRPDEIRDLADYDTTTSPGKPTIRGHKLFWHQGRRDASHLAETEEVGTSDTQHTQLKPINEKVTFKFLVRFENLSPRELGALCWTLHPLGDERVMSNAGGGYCHNLGMGKSLGMGAVKLRAKMHLTDRFKRYERLFDGESWETGSEETILDLDDAATLQRLVRPFEDHIIEELSPMGGPNVCSQLRDLRRISMLLRMMEFPGIVPQLPATVGNRPGNTRHMSLRLSTGRARPPYKNEFRTRPVLPDPSDSQFSDISTSVGNCVPQLEPPVENQPLTTERAELRRSSDDIPSPAAQDQVGSLPSSVSTQRSNSAFSAPKHPSKPALTSAPRPRPSQGFEGEKPETVVLESVPEAQKADVKARDGSHIKCSNFNPYGAYSIGQEVKAIVKYVRGKPVKARFKA